MICVNFSPDSIFSPVTCPRVPAADLFVFFLSFYFRSEYSAFWRCVKAGAAYLVTQLCKVKVSRRTLFSLLSCHETLASQLFSQTAKGYFIQHGIQDLLAIYKHNQSFFFSL